MSGWTRVRNSSGYTFGEEIANALTHGVGVGLAVAALAVLVTFAGLYGDAWRVVGFAIYGATLILLYLASTMYHAFTSPRAKRVFKALDHAAIFLLIAGTYTPFTLVTLRGPWGWTLFGLIWGFALAGITFETLFLGRYMKLVVGFYIAMGWLVVIAIKPLVDSLPLGGLLWVSGGGLAYTGGVAFYAWKSLPFSHAVWHLFVLAGSTCHFFAMWFYVLPMA
jgi:hemolysin III